MRGKRLFSILNKASKPLIVGAAFFAGYTYRDSQPSLNPVKTQPLPHAVLIDWDNCLCNTAPRILKRLQLVAAELKRRHPKIEIEEANLLMPITSTLKTHLQNLFGEAYSAEAYSLYMEYMNHKDIPAKKPFPGAADFLQQLINEGIPFAIVSNATNNFVKQGIDDFAWNHLLKDVPIITEDDVGSRNKPNPVHFLAALERLNINLHTEGNINIKIIGDGSDTDMLGAMKLAEQIALPHINISAIWINHGRPLQCQVNAVSSFDDVHQLLFSTSQSTVKKVS